MKFGLSEAYICPFTKCQLEETEFGLLRKDKTIFPYLISDVSVQPIPNFLEENKLGEFSRVSLDMYKNKETLSFYRNFLEWLFQSFEEDETSFRQKLLSKLKLKKGDKVLVVGCGLGEDLPLIANVISHTGMIYAQDLSSAMILHAQEFAVSTQEQSSLENVFFSIGDACNLPFTDDFFDAAFHFGGINLFDDVHKAILEMDRVVRPGGRVVFGDEGIAPWLKETEYGKIAINNNSLWALNAPLNYLPEKAMDVNLSWLLGNCFYLIDFEVSNRDPIMNIDLPHKGKRGGTMRTRYYGNLEGVTPGTKEKVIKAAENAGISVHEWLEKIISRQLEV